MLRLFLAMLLATTAFLAQAGNAFVIRDITINGLENRQATTVKNDIGVRVGETFDQDVAQKIIKNLFATGFFEDVVVSVEDNHLIIDVVERPIIEELTVNGAAIINGALLKKALNENGIGESLIFNPMLVDSAIKSLKSVYFEKGKYNVHIVTRQEKLSQSRLKLAIDIIEGPTATIRSIELTGNTLFSESDLKKGLSLKTKSLFSFFSSDSEYTSEKLNQDIKSIESFYKNRGFLNAKVDSAQVFLSPDKKMLDVFFNIDEGKSYAVGFITFLGDTILPEKTLRELLTLKSAERYSEEKLDASIDAIKARLGDEGYAFAAVNPKKHLDEATGKTNIDLYIDAGFKVYIRHIDITGNVATKDEVIRQEMRMAEKALFNQSQINRSKERIKLLGYFSSVDIKVKPVEGATDQVDLVVVVQDMQVGSANITASYSAETKAFLPVISIINPNFLGSGQSLQVRVGGGADVHEAQIAWNHPYFFGDDIGLGADFSFKSFEVQDLEKSVLDTEVTLALPVTDDNNVYIGLGVERYTCEPKKAGSGTQDNTESAGENALACKSDELGKPTMTGRLGWSYDTRDTGFFPTDGALHKLDLKAGFLGTKYYIVQYENSIYFPLSRIFTFLVHSDLEIGGGYGGSTLPSFKSLYAGGIGSIRGFEDNSLGYHSCLSDENESECASANSENLGASHKFITSFELRFPLLGLPNTEKVRLSAYLDCGSLWGSKPDSATEEEIKFKDGFRVSAGLGLVWLSPVAPLEFSYTFWHGHANKDDKKEPFQFYIGYKF